MSRNVVIAIVAVVAVLGLGLFFVSNLNKPSPQPQTNQTVQPTPTVSESSEEAQVRAQQNVVTVTSTGFSPQNLAVKIGAVVTWANDDSKDHTVNSAPHPTHTSYPPLNNIGTLKAGEKKGFMFDAAGTYNYHDHLNPSLTGTITVE